MNTIFRFGNPKLSTVTLGPGLLVRVSNANIVTMRPRFRLFRTINTNLIGNRLRRVATRATTPMVFPCKSTRCNAVTVFSVQPRLYGAGLPRRLFSNGDTRLGIRETFRMTYRPIPRHFRAHSFLQMSNRGVYFTMSYVTRYARYLHVVNTWTTRHRRFPIKPYRHSKFSLRISLSSSFECILTPVPTRRPVTTQCKADILLLP